MRTSILLSSLLLSACAATSPRHPSDAKPASITVIATADFHGDLVGDQNLTADGARIPIGGATPQLAGSPRIFRGDDSGTRQIPVPKPKIFRPPQDSK